MSKSNEIEQTNKKNILSIEFYRKPAMLRWDNVLISVRPI